MSDATDLAESHQSMRQAWQTFGRCSSGGRVLQIPGGCLVDAAHPWLFTNAVFLDAPVRSGAELQDLAGAARAHFQPSGHGWFLAASEAWLGSEAEALLGGLGLSRAMTVVGMATDRLRPPVRPLPEVELRPIGDASTRRAIAELNAEAYGVPPEWGVRAIGHGRLWQEPVFGSVASCDGEPAAACLVLVQEQVLYVAWLATASRFRGRGLAELVMRHSLEAAAQASGLERTVLHATAAGVSVYARMGYRRVADFPLWVPPAA